MIRYAPRVARGFIVPHTSLTHWETHEDRMYMSPWNRCSDARCGDLKIAPSGVWVPILWWKACCAVFLFRKLQHARAYRLRQRSLGIQTRTTHATAHKHSAASLLCSQRQVFRRIQKTRHGFNFCWVQMHSQLQSLTHRKTIVGVSADFAPGMVAIRTRINTNTQGQRDTTPRPLKAILCRSGGCAFLNQAIFQECLFVCVVTHTRSSERGTQHTQSRRGVIMSAHFDGGAEIAGRRLREVEVSFVDDPTLDMGSEDSDDCPASPPPTYYLRVREEKRGVGRAAAVDSSSNSSGSRSGSDSCDGQVSVTLPAVRHDL